MLTDIFLSGIVFFCQINRIVFVGEAQILRIAILGAEIYENDISVRDIVLNTFDDNKISCIYIYLIIDYRDEIAQNRGSGESLEIIVLSEHNR